jgi:hypothetical protein
VAAQWFSSALRQNSTLPPNKQEKFYRDGFDGEDKFLYIFIKAIELLAFSVVSFL